MLKRRFKQYVSPELVEQVLHSPPVQVTPEFHEATVLLGDVTGFVTPPEPPQPVTSVLAASYAVRSTLANIVKRHGGFLETVLGDAFKAVFDAPVPRPDHALRAVAAAMEMRDAIRELGGGRSLSLGVATGKVALGDLGSTHWSVYGSFGYQVYVAQRLERANRLFGTSLLVNEQAADFVRDRVLVRQIARLRFEDWDKPVAAYEPVARLAAAADAQRQLVLATRELLDHFSARRFDRCVEVSGTVEALGSAGVARLYRFLAERYLKEPPGPEFDGGVDAGDSPRVT